MRKILLAFDITHFPESAFRFIERMNEAQRILLVATIMPALTRYGDRYLEPMAEGIAYDLDILHEYEAAVSETTAHLKVLCERNDIEYRIHQYTNNDLFYDLQKESRFADLLVVGNEQFYKELGTEQVNSYLHKVLRQAECPVLIVPDKLTVPNNVVLAYDGSASSVYAIRQFAYLMPEFTGCPTQLIVFADESNEEIPDLPYVEELAARHFPDLTIHHLALDSREYFSVWVDTKKDTLVVMGAFGRSGFSEIFRKSLADEVITDKKFPVMIAHK